MTAKMIWLLTAAADQTATASASVDYFLKGLNTPFWHWLFRLGFGLGLAAALLVYFYYHANDSDRR